MHFPSSFTPRKCVVSLLFPFDTPQQYGCPSKKPKTGDVPSQKWVVSLTFPHNTPRNGSSTFQPKAEPQLRGVLRVRRAPVLDADLLGHLKTHAGRRSERKDRALRTVVFHSVEFGSGLFRTSDKGIQSSMEQPGIGSMFNLSTLF